MSPGRSSLCLLVLVACGGAPADPPPTPPEPAPFRFETTGADEVNLLVTEGQTPLPRVFVVLRESVPLADDGVTDAGPVLFEGMTDDAGRCVGRLARPLALERIQVTLHSPGREGRYDDPARREAHGAAAPAAWFSVAPADLSRTHVTLARKVSP